jgi:hypothetical protein
MDEPSSNEPVPKGKNKPIKLVPSKAPLRPKDKSNELRKKKDSKASGLSNFSSFYIFCEVT